MCSYIHILIHTFAHFEGYDRPEHMDIDPIHPHRAAGSMAGDTHTYIYTYIHIYIQTYIHT